MLYKQYGSLIVIIKNNLKTQKNKVTGGKMKINGQTLYRKIRKYNIFPYENVYHIPFGIYDKIIKKGERS